MLTLSDEQAEELARAVAAAAARPELAAAVADLYARVRAEVEARQPVCEISGRCCRFEQFGHRLFVTTVELSAFVRDAGRPMQGFGPQGSGPAGSSPSALSLPVAWDGSGCPFQVAGRCGVHPIRPFGCRIYFCDATAEAWQQAQYERFHADIRHLHERFEVPYFYVEWREAIRAVSRAS